MLCSKCHKKSWKQRSLRWHCSGLVANFFCKYLISQFVVCFRDNLLQQYQPRKTFFTRKELEYKICKTFYLIQFSIWNTSLPNRFSTMYMCMQICMSYVRNTKLKSCLNVFNVASNDTLYVISRRMMYLHKCCIKGMS